MTTSHSQVARGPKEILGLIEERARGLVDAPAEAFLETARLADLSQVFEGLVYLENGVLLQELVDRLGALIGDPSSRIRRRALEATALLMKRAGSEVREMLLASLGGALQRAVLAERDPAVLETLPEAAVTWALVATERGRWPILAGFYTLAIKPRLDDPATPVLFARVLRDGLRRLADFPGRHPILDLVESGPAALKKIMEPLLPILGSPLVPALETAILESSKPEIARNAAVSLARIDAGAASELAGRLAGPLPRATALRLLDVVDLLHPRNLGAALQGALRHPDREVRARVPELLARLDRAFVVTLIRSLAARGDDELLGPVLGVVGRRKLHELTADLVRLALECPRDEIVSEAVLALAKFPSPAALPAYRRAVERCGGLFTRVKALPEAVRARAAAAALEINTPEARQVVERALKDKSREVQRGAEGLLG